MSSFATVLHVLFMLLILLVSVDASTGFDAAEEEEKEGVQMETDESSMFSADTKVLRLSPKNFRGITDGIRHPNVKKMDPETMSKAEKAKLDIMMKDAKDPSKARTNPNAIGLLVLFYTEWCGHCQELVPIFDQASKEIDYYAKAEGEGNPMTRVHLVAVDASGDEASKALHEEYGISQFPTLQWWRGGFFSDEYSGKLPVTESTELVDWVIFRMTSTTTGAEDIPTAKDGRQFIEDTNQRGETAVIGFLDEPQEFGSHFAHKSFQRCASHRRPACQTLPPNYLSMIPVDRHMKINNRQFCHAFFSFFQRQPGSPWTWTNSASAPLLGITPGKLGTGSAGRTGCRT